MHRQVMERHGLKVLHHLDLVNAVTTALPDDRLAALEGDPRVMEVHPVNREAIVQEITKMGRITATGVLPPGIAGHDPDFEGCRYDPDKAKRLLAEAGYPGGTGFPAVQLWSVPKAESTKAEWAAYQGYLAAPGVKAEVHFAADWPVYRDLLEQGKLPMFRTPGAGSRKHSSAAYSIPFSRRRTRRQSGEWGSG